MSYFEIENTPEHIRRARRRTARPECTPKEECPRLVLAPFSRPPQVVFDNVLIGDCCERDLEVFNPTKQTQQITLGKALPPGLLIHLPGESLVLEPETCYCLSMSWTPDKPTALRETIRFTNENRGRYDVFVVLKSAMNIKKKTSYTKGLKISPPGKIIKKKQGKKSPGAIYKKKCEAVYNVTKLKKTVIESTYINVLKPSNRDNVSSESTYINVLKPSNRDNVSSESTYINVLKPSNRDNVSSLDDSIDPRYVKCPFDSPDSVNFNFDTSAIFSNMRKTCHENIETNENTYTTTNKLTVPGHHNNVLKPSNKQNCDISASELFDNLTFTPLKSVNEKNEKLSMAPKVIQSLISDSDLDNSYEIQLANKENETHSIICIKSTQPPSIKLNENHGNKYLESELLETPNQQNKKIPNTSSPKEMNSPNFTMNTELSRISDMSFFPQRYSTEKKVIPKLCNDTVELFEDLNVKLNSDTYTKDSPNAFMDYQVEKMPHYFMKDQPKYCRQALFRESQQYKDIFDKYHVNSELGAGDRDIKNWVKSPPRSITPPLQSIPEESTCNFDTQTTFILPSNRTFDKTYEKGNTSTGNANQTWSKKLIKSEPELWKIPAQPPRKSLKPKASIGKDVSNGKPSINHEINKSKSQNISLNQIGNVYSQSATVDPFLSASYFYDEEAVHKLEVEFKKWLNYILTPPADLDSNVEQKIDIGKAWFENRNKEVPTAPTKEQVSSAYHNNHRLESLRRTARALLLSPEIKTVMQKLNMQIDKKLIAIRTDKNLHLDVGLQKMIMELLLSYNPLWLRIGLEAIYDVILPLRSNSDIEGLTSFIIQRMFKNPNLKSKQSKTSAPNMLLPVYMEAIKKFTLKKFFLLVFFLDQAKQKKIISHDPCLFCRNAVCKESREIIIRFTKELIAGMGDITKHLRPLGYIVSHKQYYLDEFKFGVHNIALDIRDGIRLTKVMEVILMKNGLLNQLRVPAVSRLQKIHNVQVALNALKQSNFVIEGDITALDIADGHREKTLSLLWQLIHVFRAPLFEKSAINIQTWWRKKYKAILENRQNAAASKIHIWWRLIQYNRRNECRRQFLKWRSSAITIQATFRMYRCRRTFAKQKKAAIVIQKFYRSYKLAKEEKKKYIEMRTSVIKIQSSIRCFLARRRYQKIRSAILVIQRAYRQKVNREKIKIRREKAAICIQKHFRRYLCQSYYQNYRNKVMYLQKLWRQKYEIILEKRRRDELILQQQNSAASTVQIWWRHTNRRNECRRQFLKWKSSAITIQARFRMYRHRTTFEKQKKAAVVIQKFYRSHKLAKEEKKKYIEKRTSIIKIQSSIRCFLARRRYQKIRSAILVIQRAYRQKVNREKIKIRREKAAICIQKHFRRYLCQSYYQNYRNKVMYLQKLWRQKYEIILEKRRRDELILQQQNSAASTVQIWWRHTNRRNECRRQFLKWKSSAITIQATFRMYRCRTTFEKQKKAALIIQRFYRSCKLAIKERKRYVVMRTSIIKIQSAIRCFLTRRRYLKIRSAILVIQWAYRQKVNRDLIRREKAALCIQKHFRRYLCQSWFQNYRHKVMYLQKLWRKKYEIMLEKRKRDELMLQKLNCAANTLQIWWRHTNRRNECRRQFLKWKSNAITIQATFRMYRHRTTFEKQKKAAVVIQKFYRSYKLAKEEKKKYIEKRTSIIKIQSSIRCFLARRRYQKIRSAILVIQRAYRQKVNRDKIRSRREKAAICIQKHFRRYLCQSRYQNYRNKVVYLQKLWRGKLIARLFYCEFQQIRKNMILLQARIRGFLLRKCIEHKKLEMLQAREEQIRRSSATIIQAHYRGHRTRKYMNSDKRLVELRQRWRAGALKSDQMTIKEQNDEALFIVYNSSNIEEMIRSFRWLEYLSEVFPMFYDKKAPSIVSRAYKIMLVTNRSISSVELLKAIAGVLVNFTRYKVTGPNIYTRDRIAPVLKFMCRFSNSETELFCILSTYLWLFSKYDGVRQDLTEYLNIPENKKLLSTMKSNVVRSKRMVSNARNTFSTPQTNVSSCVCTRRQSNVNFSMCNSKNNSILLPAVEPDYGITRADKPKYFVDPHEAITSLFRTYNL